MDYYEIGQNIRKLRKAHGLSQEELAEIIDISTTHMSHIETGNTKLSLPVLVSLAGALSTSTDELLGRDTAKNPAVAISEIHAVLDRCTPQQTKVIAALVKAAKGAMDQYL